MPVFLQDHAAILSPHTMSSVESARGCWNLTVPGHYLCISSADTYDLYGQDRKLKAGEIYQNQDWGEHALHLYAPIMFSSLRPSWFCMLVNSSAIPAEINILTSKSYFEQCLYGPLTSDEVDEYSIIRHGGARIKKYQATEHAASIRKATLGAVTPAVAAVKPLVPDPPPDPMHEFGMGMSKQETWDEIVEKLKSETMLSVLCNFNRVMSIQELENYTQLKIADWFTTAVVADCFTVASELISVYSMKKHSRNFEEMKRCLPDGLPMFTQSTTLNKFVFIGPPDIISVARERVELVQHQVTVPPYRRDHFRFIKSTVLERVEKKAGCSAQIRETKLIILTGLQSEVHAGKKILEEYLGALQSTPEQAKSKPKENNRANAKVADPVAQPVREVKAEAGKKVTSKKAKRVDRPTVERPQGDSTKRPQKCTNPTSVDVPAKQSEGPNEAEEPKSTAIVEEKRVADCLICMSEPSSAVLIPCGHVQTCLVCAQKLFKSKEKRCSTCRRDIEEYYRVWI